MSKCLIHSLTCVFISVKFDKIVIMNSLEILNPEVEILVVDEVVEDSFRGLETRNTSELALTPEKNVSVEKDDRYTRIYIDKKMESQQLNDKYSDLYLKVKIIKDRILKTTETHIQKMFVSYDSPESEDLDVIIRDIYVDRAGGKSKRDASTARTKMKRTQFVDAFRNTIASKSVNPSLLLEN